MNVRGPNGDAFAAGDHFSLQLIGPDRFTDRSGDYRALEHQIPAGLRDRGFGRNARGDDGLWLWVDLLQWMGKNV